MLAGINYPLGVQLHACDQGSAIVCTVQAITYGVGTHLITGHTVSLNVTLVDADRGDGVSSLPRTMHVNTRRDMADGKSGTRQVSIRMLQPRPRASCLSGGNEVCYPADNDEPRCKICRQGTRPREPT